MSYHEKSNLSSIVAPPPSAKSQKGGTNLDNALSHLRPSLDRLLPRIDKNEKSGADKAAQKTKR